MCPKCGAAVPLGDGELAHCAYCATDVPIPSDYIALRADANTRGRDRDQLERLYVTASRVPTAFLRGLAAMGRGVLIGGMCVGALIIVATVIGVIVREQDLMTALISALLMFVLAIPAFLETMLHLVTATSYDLVDGFGPFAGVLPGVVVWLLVAAPLQISRTARTIVGEIFALRHRLAAGKPVQPGGPATCRGCGAALDVSPGALGVRCTYCQTDNLVAVPGVAAAADHRETSELHRDIEQVVASHTRELAIVRGKLTRRLGASLVALACLFGVLYFPAHWFLDGSTTMHRASSHRGVLLSSDDLPAIPSGEARTVELSFLFRCHGESDRRCIHYYVALNRGDRVSFESSNKAIAFAMQRHEHLVLAVGEWEPWVNDAAIATRAPYTGWYRVEVAVPLAMESATTTFRWFVN